MIDKGSLVTGPTSPQHKHSPIGTPVPTLPKPRGFMNTQAFPMKAPDVSTLTSVCMLDLANSQDPYYGEYLADVQDTGHKTATSVIPGHVAHMSR